MCCLFGVLDHNNTLGNKQLNRILNVLATACEARGTDAAGIAYNSSGRLRIYKRPVPAHNLRICVPRDVTAVMGHTRMTTQGSEKMNYNNHPFYGSAEVPFTLAHNGVIHNDEFIRRCEHLPTTRIDTDSYIAVQLIEKKGKLGFDSLRYMAEQLEGSFTITVMDNTDNLYIVKGDNPICLYHYPKSGVYIYASTEEILQSALKKLRLNLGKHEKISVTCGEILKIESNGNRIKEKFNADRLYYSAYPYYFGMRPVHHHTAPDVADSFDDYMQDYLEELKNIAYYFGYSNDYIDYLLDEGYTFDEIEEELYCV